MEGGRRTSTVQQLQLLVEFAEANRDLALGRLRSKEARALSTRLWRECAESLNSEGPGRLPKEWTKVWNDMKSRVRSKLMCLNQSQRGTGGGPNSNVALSSLEERVADIIGRDIGPIPNVAQNQFRQASPEGDLLEEVGMGTEQHESIVVEYIDEEMNVPGPSHRLSPLRARQSPRPSPRTSPQPSALQASVSRSPTPRRQRESRRQRPRQGPESRARTRESRVGQAQTSRAELNESRGMMMRIEELRARTDSMLAEAALKQSEAAKVQAEAALVTAEANRVQAQALQTFCEAVSSLVPAARLYFQRRSRKTRRISSSSEEH